MNQLNKEMEFSTINTQTNTITPENVWTLGDYRTVSTMLPPVSSHLVDLIKIKSGESVLDVACGNGNTAITARRKGANVIGIDITPELLEIAKEEEKIAQVTGIEWKEGDAQNLPFEDESFDVVLSTFGHMFASRPDLAAKELIRVTKEGGRIGFATWSPELAIGSIFKVNAKHLPRDPQAPPSPILWGNPDVVQERLSGVSELYFERGTLIFSILSPNHFWDRMSTRYGPLVKAIRVLNNTGNPSKVESLRNDFLRAIDPYIVDNGIRLGYLLTLAIK
jgi:SAM-dependent methyltransferase